MRAQGSQLSGGGGAFSQPPPPLFLIGRVRNEISFTMDAKNANEAMTCFINAASDVLRYHYCQKNLNGHNPAP